MITRRARPRYRVAVEVPHAGGWRTWNAVAAAFEQRLAAQASPAVHEPRLESETRRGSDVVRVRIAVTVRAADPGQAAVIAWDVFKVAVGEDAAMWDLGAASAEIRPEGRAPRLNASRRSDVGAGISGSLRKPLHAGVRAPSVYHVSARVMRQNIRRPEVPQAARTGPELPGEASALVPGPRQQPDQEDAVSPLPTQMTTHWWQRPGRLPGRELYHWHMLFHDQPKVHELVTTAQKKLAGQPGLDMIDIPWLHMTTYIVGFADEVSHPAIEAMTAEARRRLSHVAPVRISLGRVGYASNAIVLPVEPPGALTAVLDAVREATHAAGCDGYSDTDPWLPHISVAYSNATIPAAPIISALGRWLPKTEITIRSISLVSQTQVGRSWQWRPVAEVHFAGEP